MRCGISTACFYPEDTLSALKRVTNLGCPVTEIFINTFSEMEDGYIARLQQEAQAGQVQVTSVHPFTAPIEGFMFATEYAARVRDGMKLYRRYYEICNALGADKLVFHGDRAKPGTFPLDLYAENIRELAEIGREYGVKLCYENVFYCRLGKPANVRRVRRIFGENAAFTLDLKQIRRAGVALEDMLDAMGAGIQLVHISDCDDERDCISPGAGYFDFPALLRRLEALGYDGDLIIELYRDGFGRPKELAVAMAYMQKLIDRMAA